MQEQQERDAAIEEAFWKMLRNGKRYRRNKTGNWSTQIHRKNDAVKGDIQMSPMNLDYARSGEMSDTRWHITYYSAADKERAERLMKVLEILSKD